MQDCRCGQRLIQRRGDQQRTCVRCRKPPAGCSCEPLTGEKYPPPEHPMGVARQLLATRRHDGQLTLRYWRGGWMQWDGTRWAEDEPDSIRSWAYKQLENATCLGPEGLQLWAPTQRKISDVADALKAVTLLPQATDSPSWLGREPAPFRAREAVICSNGILHVLTEQLHALTPRLFSQVAVPFPYAPDTPEPAAWLEFLAQLWPDDPESVQALQQWFGYVLSGRTDMHKILLFVGPPRSGRGTIARILTALLGQANVASPTLASMATQFGLQPLIGIPLAIIGDARLGHQTDASQVVERLLSISGEDMLTVDRKHKPAWTGKLPTRFIIVSNELPQFADASGAIATRFLILSLQRSFLGEEDHSLTEKLLTELPGILQWALRGLASLTEQDRFTVPQSSEDATSVMQDIASPIRAFIRDRCLLNGEVAVEDIWKAWKEWAEDNNHRKGSKQVFGRDLRAAYPSIRMTQPRAGEEGKQIRVYVGISLKFSPVDPAIGENRVSPRVTPSEQGKRDEPSRADRASDEHQEQLTRVDTRTGPYASPTGGNSIPGAKAGRCAWCGEPCTRYGPDGKPLCDHCEGSRQGTPNPLTMPKHRRSS